MQPLKQNKQFFCNLYNTLGVIVMSVYIKCSHCNQDYKASEVMTRNNEVTCEACYNQERNERKELNETQALIKAGLYN